MSIDDEIGKTVRRLRELLGVDHLLQMDMIRVLNEMKTHGLIADWVVVPDLEMPKVDGHWKPETRVVYPTGADARWC